MKILGFLFGVGTATISFVAMAQAPEPMSAAQLDTVTAGSDPIPGLDVKLGRNPPLHVSILPGTGIQVTYGSKLSVGVGPNWIAIKENGVPNPHPPHPHP